MISRVTTTAITRHVSRSIARCELTHVEREPIDVEVARAEHDAYCALLDELGCDVVQLPEAPDLPDSVFVEDTALVLDELAVLTRPGAESRRPEVPLIARALRRYRPVAEIEAPATLDGGDILVIGRAVYVGLSARSSTAGVEALARILAPHGYTVRGTPMRDCLHLKSAASVIGNGLVLVNPAWVDPSDLGDRTFVEIDASEPFAANAVRLDNAIVHSSSYPRTKARIEARGIRVASVPASELAKAEGGVTCCSLLVRDAG